MKNQKKTVQKKPVKSPISKQELAAQIQQKQNVEHIKQMVRDIWPLIAEQDTVYDAQTVVNALSGFISAHIEKKVSELKVSDLPIDLSKEKDSKIKTAIEKMMKQLEDEPAKDTAVTLERLGKTLGEFCASKMLKQPMDTIKVTDIVA